MKKAAFLRKWKTILIFLHLIDVITIMIDIYF